MRLKRRQVEVEEDDTEKENTTEDEFVAKIGIDLTSILKQSTQEQVNEFINNWINQLEVKGYNLNNLSDNQIIILINQLVEDNSDLYEIDSKSE